MSFFSFVLRAYALSPFVFLRYLPALITFSLILVGIILSTNNIWVIGLVCFIMGTFGAAFMVLNGIRAGLGTIGATEAGTAEGYMHVIPRLLFAHLLLQFIFAMMIAGIAYLIIDATLLSTVAPGVFAEYREVFGAYQSGKASAIANVEPLIAGFEADPGPFRLVALVINGGLYVIFAICVGVFGVPMAALSANAVQYTPRNDLIYGLGRYFPHQFVLYLLAMALPVVLITLLLPVRYQFDMLVGGTGSGVSPVVSIVIGIYFLYAPCISYAGMAIGYERVRGRVMQARQAESRPQYDMVAERENLSSLRKQRTAGRSGANVYDPVAKARAKRQRGD